MAFPAAVPVDFEIAELDAAGNLNATYYVQSGPSGPKPETGGRIDVIVPKNSKSPWQKLLDVFLPDGYPGSVTEDYIWYQIYDSLQAFSSSIAGLLSNRAVLEGVGVGDASASPTAALLLSVFQESAGRIATILFAHRFGTALEPECKRWRLAADIFNDAAMVLDLLSPVFPKPVRVGVLAGSGVLRALCGVAAGSAKASLSAHFAKQGNLGEVNAKDSSQETVISLMGMLAGTVVVSLVTDKLATWVTLLLLLAIHLAMNTAAVRSVSMRSLNRQRANIVFSTLLASDEVLTPPQVSAKEWIFEKDGVLTWADGVRLGTCKIGVSLKTLIRSIEGSKVHTRSIEVGAPTLPQLIEVFRVEDYILWYEQRSKSVYVVFKETCTARSQAKAWCHALMLAKEATGLKSTSDDGEVFELVSESLQRTKARFYDYTRRLEAAGWNLNVAALETQSGRRVTIQAGAESKIAQQT